MSTGASISTPTAILIGSGIVAAGLFVMIWRLSPSTAAVEPPVTPATPATPATPVVARDTVTRQATEALAYQLGTLRTRCPPPPGEHKFTLNVTFDALGVEVTRGITEMRTNPPSELGSCIAGTLIPLRVPPPGAVTMVELTLSLP